MNYQQFIAATQITMTADRVDANPNMAADNMDHWRVTLRMGRSRMSTYFSMGYGHNGKAPKAGVVLESLASDASSVQNAQDFEDWASDLGYDPDSRSAHRTYQTIIRQAARLQKFLGVSAYLTLLNDVEDTAA